MRNARQHNIEINSLHSPAPERIIRIAVQEAIYEINEKLLKSIIQMYVIVMPDYSNCKMRHTPASDNTKKKFFFHLNIRNTFIPPLSLACSMPIFIHF